MEPNVNHLSTNKSYNEHPDPTEPFRRLKISTKEAAVTASLPVYNLNEGIKLLLLLQYKWVKVDFLQLNNTRKFASMR